MHDATHIWMIGEPWRDLASEVAAAGPLVAAMSEHGTKRLLDLRHGWQMRLPAAGRGGLPHDFERDELWRVGVATPCGIITMRRQRPGWSATSRLLAVVSGELDAIAEAMTAVPDSAPDWSGHPRQPCGAVYCIRTALPAAAQVKDGER